MDTEHKLVDGVDATIVVLLLFDFVDLQKKEDEDKNRKNGKWLELRNEALKRCMIAT